MPESEVDDMNDMQYMEEEPEDEVLDNESVHEGSSSMANALKSVLRDHAELPFWAVTGPIVAWLVSMLGISKTSGFFF